MRKHYLKIGVIVIALVCLLRIHPGFVYAATGDATTPMTVSTTTQLFNALLKFLSWGRMILAFFAGKLMSNDFVYGTFIHLDSALFLMRNYMKNIANFTLGFLFLYSILKSLFGKDTYSIKTVLPRYLLAGVLIQMSRFVMGAFIDLSNIATAAVGAFPTAFIQGSTGNLSKSKINELSVTVPVRVDVSFKENQPLFTTHTGSQTIGGMFAKFNNMSGPLLFIGAGIFRFQDYDIMNSDITNRKNFSIGLFIKLLLLIMFCVPMFVLVVLNLIRIFKLWLWIAFAPLAAIARSFDSTGAEKDTPGFIKSAGESLGFGKLSNVLKLIFQPVAMIGSLSLVMIISIAMYYMLGGQPGSSSTSTTFNKTIEQVQLDAKGSVSTLKDMNSNTEISIDGDLFKNMGNFVGGMIGYLILTGFTIILIWTLIKIGASFSDFTDSAAKSIFGFAQGAVTSAHIIPLGAGKAPTSIGGLMKAPEQLKSDLQSHLRGKENTQIDELQTSFYQSNFGKSYQKFTGQNHEQEVQRDITTSDATNLEKSLHEAAATSSTNNASSIAQILMQLGAKRKQEGKTITPQSKKFIDTMNTLLKNDQRFKARMSELASIPEGKERDTLSFDTTTENNKKLMKSLAYLMNNNYHVGETRETKIDEEIKSKMGSTSFAADTPLIFGIPEKE